MSATIQIKQSADSTPFFLYRTWKGFPEACGEAILCELEFEYNWRAEKIATGLVQSKDEYGFLLFEIANGEYGDERFKYIIDCDSKTIQIFEKQYIHRSVFEKPTEFKWVDISNHAYFQRLKEKYLSKRLIQAA